MWDKRAQMSDDKLDAARTLHLLDGDESHGAAMAHDEDRDDDADSLEEDHGVSAEEMHHEDSPVEIQPEEIAHEEHDEIPAAAEAEPVPPPVIAQLGPEKHWYII